ncbi:hypothetical protein NXS19_004124 [Fusarium pseudograminearum]|nr:hypothetical protein NXS19_004124 [Fusarium pseudograminearum]
MEEVRKMGRKEEGEGGAKLEFGDLECALLFWGNSQRKREASALAGFSVSRFSGICAFLHQKYEVLNLKLFSLLLQRYHLNLGQGQGQGQGPTKPNAANADVSKMSHMKYVTCYWPVDDVEETWVQLIDLGILVVVF